MKLTCCCGAVVEISLERMAGMKAMVDATPGWNFAWDISNGLSPVWLCGACAGKARELLEGLRSVFAGIDLRNINFTPVLRER